MNLDIRLPMGLMFTLVGAILVVYGAVTRGANIYVQHSLGFNINLSWGAVLLLFGILLLGMAIKSMRRKP